MTDEDLTIAPVELETAIAPEAPTEPTVADAPERIPDPREEQAAQAGDEATAEELELVEIEWDDGKKYTIPKALEGGLLKNKDYTTKTQETAALKKTLESREAEINQRLEATDEELEMRAEHRAVKARLEAYGQLSKEDWAAHRAADYIATDEAWRDYQELKERNGELAKTLETKASERTRKAELDLATRVEETRAFAEKQIPGWKPELTEKLVKFALDNGVPEDALKTNWSPTFYKLLHRAQIGESVIQKQATAQKLPAAPVEPLATVGGKSTPAARGDLASLDMDAYVAARKKGVGGKPLR